jgi:hypothetical protein
MTHKIAVFIGLVACSLAGGEIQSPLAPFVQGTKMVEKVVPKFKGEDEIALEGKHLRFNETGHFTDADFIANGRTLFSLKAMSSPSIPRYAPFQYTASLAGNQMERKAAFRVDENVTGTYRERFEILPDGQIGCHWTNKLSSPLKRNPLFRALFFTEGVIKPLRFLLNGKALDIVEISRAQTNWREFEKKYGPPKTLTLALDVPELECQIQFVNIQHLRIVRLFGRICLRLQALDNDREAGMIIAPGLSAIPGKTDNIVSGINFTRNNDFEVAVFQENGNLLMNPSFESGMRYYTAWKQAYPNNGLYSGEARTGQYSYRFDKGYKKRMYISSLGIPVKMNRKYTFSFYAKSTNKKSYVVSTSYFTYIPSARPANKTFKGKNNQEWKRFEYSFVSKAKAIQFRLSASENCIIDDLQLEESDHATEYKGNPVGLDLVSDSPDPCNINTGSSINARLLFRGKSGENIRGSVQVKDFFGHQIFTSSFAGVIAQNGEFIFKLKQDAIWKKGLNIIRVQYGASGNEVTDFLRLSLYNYADNTAKNKNLHGIFNYPDFSIFPENEISFAQSLGIGALSASLDYSKECFEKQKKYGFDDFGRTWYVQKVDFKPQKVRWHIVDGEPLTLNGTTYLEAESYPPEFLEKTTKLVQSFAEKHPWVTFYEGLSEPQGSYQTLRKHKLDEFCRFMLAVKKGIENANPENVFCPLGSYNMGRSGREDVLSVLKKCRELAPNEHFKSVDIHTYRSFPEAPDTEQDLKAFIKGLAELGYTKDNFKIKLREGSYFYPLIVNEYYIAPWGGVSEKDRFSRLQIPSYDLGWGERVAAALWLRSILVYYKYADHLLMTCPWLGYTIDQNVPYAWALASAALTDILGNATYLKDVRFSPNTRCYLFDDGKGATVAAIWKYSEQLDRGYEPGTVMDLDFGNVSPETFDMMGNQCSAAVENGRCRIPLTNFPVFLRSKNAALLEKAISQSRVLSEQDENPIHIELAIQSADNVRIVMQNRFSRPISAKISIEGEKPVQYNWKAFDNIELTRKLKSPLSFNEFNEISIPYTVQTESGKLFKDSFSSNILPVKHAGETVDWRQIPFVPIKHIGLERLALRNNMKWRGPDDFSTMCKLAWNEKNLYVYLAAKDDELVYPPSDMKPTSYYSYEGAQLFFDAFGDAVEKNRRGVLGYDQNDFSYELLPVSDNKAIAFRRLAPDIQFTGGALHPFRSNEVVPEITCGFNVENNTRIYQTALSAHFLKPLRLEPGNTFGLAIKIMDRDLPQSSPCKLNACNIPQEKGDPFRQPHLYTQILLIK